MSSTAELVGPPQQLAGAVLGPHQLVVAQQPLGGRTVEHDPAAVEHDHTLAHPLHRAGVVGDEHERRPGGDLLGDPAQALALKRLVADGQHLVDQHHVGVEVGGDRETRAGRTCRWSRS